MLSKETFCMALRMIQEQQATDERFSQMLQEMGNGHFVFGAENKYCKALLKVLAETMDDRYEYIEWWLYETSDYVVSMQDHSKEWNLEKPEDLYDYLSAAAYNKSE